MAGDIKIKYPATSSTAVTITLASLASDATLVAGRESTVINNTTNLDIDHLISGIITLASSGLTITRTVQVWAYSFETISSNTPTLVTPFTGVDSNRSIPSVNWRDSALKLLWATITDNVGSRAYNMPATSIAQAFGGTMPPAYGLWVVQSTGQALSSGSLNYTRVQSQYT